MSVLFSPIFLLMVAIAFVLLELVIPSGGALAFLAVIFRGRIHFRRFFQWGAGLRNDLVRRRGSGLSFNNRPGFAMVATHPFGKKSV